MLSPAPTHDPTDWTADLGDRVAQARRRARLSQKALARASGISSVWLSKIERGLVKKYPFDTLAKLGPLIGLDLLPVESEDVVGRGDPVQAGHRLPIYTWGAIGDPRDADSHPDADHEDQPPLGRESLVGRRGFGVVVRGESMAPRGIHDGDTVWINPERAPRYGRPALVRIFDYVGKELGLAVYALGRNSGADELCDAQGALTEGLTFEVVGPVVGISTAFRLPL